MNKTIIFLLLFFNLLMSTSISFAQETSADIPGDITQLSLEELMELEVDTVYGASKYEQKVTEAPSSVSIITSDDIKKYGYRSLAEILKSIRGFQITNDRNYSYLNVRGFGLPGDYNSRILLLIDGHPVNDNIYNMALIGREFPLEIDLIDRVEVVRGPSSSLYGTSAFFAVINVITRKGRAMKGFEVSGEAGSFDSYKERLSYGNKFSNGMETLLSASYFDSKGNERLYFREFDAPSTNNGTAEGLDYERYKNFFAEMKFHDFTLQGNYHSRKKGIPTASYESLFNNDGYFTVDEQYWLDLKYEHMYSSKLNILARVNYNNYYYHGDYPFEDDPDIGEPNVVMNKDYGRGEWIDGELQFIDNLSDKHKFILGAYYHNNLRQEQGNDYIGADWGRFKDKRSSSNWALYAQDEFHINADLILNAGLRYDHYNTTGCTVNPRTALIYTLFDQTTLKLVYGRAFRTPNAYELYYNDGFITQKPSLDLEPEVINTYEAIYEQYFGNNFHGTIVGFFYKIDHLIALHTDPEDGLLIFQNVDKVDAKGVELEMEGKWKSGFDGRISYAFQETEDKQTGKPLVNSAKHLVKLNVTVPLVTDKLLLGAEEQYTSRRRNVSGTYTGGFSITNITLLNKNALKNFEVSAGVYNLFDKKYNDPASEEHVQKNIEQDGRSFRLKLSYKF